VGVDPHDVVEPVPPCVILSPHDRHPFTCTNTTTLLINCERPVIIYISLKRKI
jgi:hypothetical protein